LALPAQTVVAARVRRPFAWAFAVALTGCYVGQPPGAPAADASPPPPDAAAPEPAPPEVGIEAIRKRGVLRVLTRNNGNSYFVWRGRRMGFAYELARRLADELGVYLEIVVPERWSEMVPMLETGQADIIAASMTVTPERAERIRFTRPLVLTNQVVVWGPRARPIEWPQDLAGRPVHVRRTATYHTRLQELSGILVEAGQPAIDIVVEPEVRETEHILEDVARGRVPYTVADHHIAQVSQTWLRRLEIGPSISDPQQVAWGVHKDAGDLADRIDSFIAGLKREPTFDVLYSRYYETPRRFARRMRDKLFTAESGRISPYDAQLKKAGERHDLDWRLLAAVMYGESRFDSKATSWAGAGGLFQLMPATAAEMGVTDRFNPEQSIRGGVAYLKRLYDDLADVPDVEERLRMTLAGFNCGPGHVYDARDIAREDPELDPDSWAGVAVGLQRLSHRKWARKARFGYVRGSAVIDYVHIIWERYRGYRHALGDRDHPEAGRAPGEPLPVPGGPGAVADAGPAAAAPPDGDAGSSSIGVGTGPSRDTGGPEEGSSAALPRPRIGAVQ
jgi:membrane-bound lytic murein transglycosylase F